MSDMSKLEIFRNFNLGIEVNIAGNFAHNAIVNLNQAKTVAGDEQVFLFLYNAAVSVERMQKCVLFMYATLTAEDIEPYAEKIKIHRHQELQNKINTLTGKKLPRDQNAFLMLLQEFYAQGRYGNFSPSSDYRYVEKLESFARDNYGEDTFELDFWGKKSIVIEVFRERVGRTYGKILHFYYRLVNEKAHELNLYTYELRAGTVSEQVFLCQDEKHSLQSLAQNDRIAIAEFLIFLRNCKEETGFFKYLDSLLPLELDPGLTQEYISDIMNHQVSQILVDEVMTAYEDMTGPEIRERREELIPLSDPHCDFDYNEAWDEE